MESNVDLTDLEGIGFSSEVKEKGKLKEFNVIPDEWYLGKISKFYPMKTTYEGKPRNQIQFYVDFQDDEFTWTKEDIKYHLRATIKFGIPTKQSEDENVQFKPNYKLWSEFITKVFNLTDEDFDSTFKQHEGKFLNLINSLLGRKIYFMVEINKSKNAKGEEKIYYNIVRIKYCQDQSKPASSQVQKPAVLKSVNDVVKPKVVKEDKKVEIKNPDGITDPKDIKIDISGPITNKKNAAEDDVFQDLNLS